MASPCSIHSNNQSQVRAVMLGESGVGKTSLVLSLSRFLSDPTIQTELKDDEPNAPAQAFRNVEPTIGAVFHRLSDSELNLGAQIWDPAGGASFQHATHDLVNSSRVVLALFNPMSSTSFSVAVAHARRILTSAHADLSLIVLVANSIYHHEPEETRNNSNNSNNNSNNRPENDINDKCIIDNNVPININKLRRESTEEALQSMHACVEELNAYDDNVTIRGMQVCASSCEGIPALWSLMIEHADSQFDPQTDSPTASVGSRRSDMSSDSLKSQPSKRNRMVRRIGKILMKQSSAHFRSSTHANTSRYSTNVVIVPSIIESVNDDGHAGCEKSRTLSASACRLFKIVRRMPRRRTSAEAEVVDNTRSV